MVAVPLDFSGMETVDNCLAHNVRSEVLRIAIPKEVIFKNLNNFEVKQVACGMLCSSFSILDNGQ